MSKIVICLKMKDDIRDYENVFAKCEERIDTNFTIPIVSKV